MTRQAPSSTSPKAHQNNRQPAIREVGLSGNYWYAVEQAKNLKKKRILEAVFWKTSIALFRDAKGQAHAIENRCAHRQLRLTELGHVEGDRVVCEYHGWSYDGCGQCVGISHHLGSTRRLPRIRIRHYPVREKYGLIWVFPGDPALADTTPLPSIPMLDGPDSWPYTPVDLTIKAHHSMVIENVCDFNHEYLHRKFSPFADSKLTHLEYDGDAVELVYDCKLGQSPMIKPFIEGQSTIKIWYQYPYQISDSNGKYLHWMFMTPIDEATTRCIFLFLAGPISLPIVKLNIPHALRKPIVYLISNMYAKQLLLEDQVALEEEQQAGQYHIEKHHYEFSPLIRTFQKLAIDKWQAYIDSEEKRMRGIPRKRERLTRLGGGISFEEMEENLRK